MKRTLTNLLLTFIIIILGLGAAGFMTSWFTDFSLFNPTDTTTDTSTDTSSSSSSDVEEELSYSLTFTVATTNTVSLDSDGIKAIGSVDAQLMSYTATENLYRQAPDSIKFGTGSSKGRLVFSLPDDLRILSVIVQAQAYGSDVATIKVNDMEHGLTSTSAAYTFDYAALETATVEITSKNTTSSRFYVSSITIIHSAEAIAGPSEPVYTRIEAERYEIQFPYLVNGNMTFGMIHSSVYLIDDSMIAGLFVALTDEDELNEDSYVATIVVYVDDSAMTEPTLPLEIETGAYGRYVIGDTQVNGEPLSYTLLPLYDYVLAD